MLRTERFWSRVKKPVEPEACWEWTGHRDRDGYGELRVCGRPKRAHRVSWELTHGDIPPGLLVCHACDNPSCVRPGHLWLGTKSDNARDSYAKGRQPKEMRPHGDAHWTRREPGRWARVQEKARENLPFGVACWGAKLTEAQVREVRERLERGQSKRSLAKEYGVSAKTIRDIEGRHTWARLK